MSRSKLPLSESSVLAACDQAASPDNWPEYRLNDAKVTLPSDSQSVSLLLASEHYPLRVTGQLEAVSRKRAHLWLLPSKPRPMYIEIAVRTFAYDDSDGVAVWAAGNAGWFKIKPSREYQSAYEEMTDAITLIYFVIDAYTTRRRQGKGKSAITLPDYSPQELFEKYAIEIMGVAKGASEAQRKIYKHRQALMSCMRDAKWAQNPLLLHLIKKFGEDWRQVRQRLEGTGTAKEKPKSSSTTKSLKRKRNQEQRLVDDVSNGSSSDSSLDSSPPVSEITGKPFKAAMPKTKVKKASFSTAKLARPIRNKHLTQQDIDDWQPSTPAMQDSDLETGRQKSGLRLKKSSKGLPRKRQPTEIVGDEEDVLPNDILDEGIDIPSSPSSNADVVGGADASEFAARKLHRPDQLQENVWSCALAGCTHKIYGPATSSETQRLIREHYNLHANFDDDARVKLVKKMTEPSLPTSHLAQRVRGYVSMELTRLEGTKTGGSRFPDLVKQKY
ncbi:hypothetical protein BDY17DRAFT_291097 [Neohortaea acidophila]|uniref:DNA (cytosine-5)-methyltransferase 1 replication foci domain-containing protein n=1 Tax=Neohortaea acidophila TaxID=245834 RepID=A0A6A6Q1T4_9PEZI|nr:uncharacterized protein BDY17DRAFT_291097 [Neohortaea acidophila]KAF2486225.1 hypothetical protein BDY17DRAFT_291097 [Neohortaea acidophila]